MAKKTPRENLKSFSIIYLILAAFYIVATILCLAIPDIANGLKSNFGNEIIIIFITGAAVSTFFHIWYFVLARRVASGKSKGTLYMILLIIGIVGSVVSAFVSKGISFLNLNTIVNLCGLYFLHQVRKEN